MKKTVFLVFFTLVALSLFALDNGNVYQTSRTIIADDVPVKAIAKISDKDVEYLYWFALYSTGAYEMNVKISKSLMEYAKEDGEKYTGVGANGFPTFNGVNKLSKKQGEILRFLTECEINGRRKKSIPDFRVWLMDIEEYLEPKMLTDPEYADKIGIIFSYRLYY
ncbi:hypothetical protein AGMMS4952_10970 [Spirochaetia bacterium]|nr:hypothetical protein AGMMS4952_10970 [Spirochaetia bacterium]